MSAIDVVVPCYQYGRFLRNSVSSILSQQAVRVLIIDNASMDDSLEVASSRSRTPASKLLRISQISGSKRVTMK